MGLEVKGKIKKFLEVQTGEKKDGSGQWKKQGFLLEIEAQYNNIFCFEVFGEDKVDNLNKYNKVGDNVNVEFNVNTNENKGNYYTTLQSWKITKTEKQGVTAPKQVVEDDLPF
jgi:uncharacterized protein YxeA